MTPSCHACGRQLVAGEPAWANDWYVIGPEGSGWVVRYFCDDCHMAGTP